MSESALAQGKTFIWHEVYGPKQSVAMDFYTKTLGWSTVSMPMPGGHPGEYTMFVANGQPVAGIIGTTEMPGMNDVPPHWSVFIGVDNVDDRLAKCQANGGTVVHGPMDVPTVGRMVLIQDPQGAHVWFFQPEQQEA